MPMLLPHPPAAAQALFLAHPCRRLAPLEEEVGSARQQRPRRRQRRRRRRPRGAARSTAGRRGRLCVVVVFVCVGSGCDRGIVSGGSRGASRTARGAIPGVTGRKYGSHLPPTHNAKQLTRPAEAAERAGHGRVIRNYSRRSRRRRGGSRWRLRLARARQPRPHPPCLPGSWCLCSVRGWPLLASLCLFRMSGGRVFLVVLGEWGGGEGRSSRGRARRRGAAGTRATPRVRARSRAPSRGRRAPARPANQNSSAPQPPSAVSPPFRVNAHITQEVASQSSFRLIPQLESPLVCVAFRARLGGAAAPHAPPPPTLRLLRLHSKPLLFPR
jgi:hypothetical protein